MLLHIVGSARESNADDARDICNLATHEVNTSDRGDRYVAVTA